MTRKVDVFVSGLVDSQGNPLIVVDEYNHVFRNWQTGQIKWTIVNDGKPEWEFDFTNPAQPPILFKQAGAPFDNPRRHGPKQFSWNNNHTRLGQWDYTISLINISTGRRHALDPSITNSGDGYNPKAKKKTATTKSAKAKKRKKRK